MNKRTREWIIAMVVYLVVVILIFSIGWFIGARPDTGMGIYFEDGRLVIDGGGQRGVVFNGNTTPPALPDWIESTAFPDGIWRNVTVRNFNIEAGND